jgi:hypothetical protein
MGDRAYGFLDVETGKLASAKRPRRFGALLGCQARFVTPPTLDEPSPPIEVTFADGTVVTDDHQELTRRTCELLGREVRLITTAPDGVTIDKLDPDFDNLEPLDSSDDRIVGIPIAQAAPGTMLDLAALHIMSDTTLRRLGESHPGGDWDPRRFRPNMLIEGDEPIDEDAWQGFDLHIGSDVVINMVGPTPRCVITTLAQGDLPRDSHVLRTVAATGLKRIGRLGQFPCAGSYAEVVEPGVVRAGDPIRVEPARPRHSVLAATIAKREAALSGNT